MDDKRRSKRKSMDDGFWDCSVCTYRNTPEAFKCEMCDVRKGTSTRKPRLNPQLVAQQVAQQFPSPPLKREKSANREPRDRDNPELKDPNFSGIENSNDSISESPTKVETKHDAQSEDVKQELKEDVDEKLIPKEIEETQDVKEPIPIQPVQPMLPKQGKGGKGSASTSNTPRTHRPRPCKLTKLRNIDRSTARSMEVTVGDVTVIFTDYKPKKDKNTSITTETTPTAPSVESRINPPSPTNNEITTPNS